MRERRARRERLRAREFDAFVAGAGGRLLHAATLLTAEPPGAAPEAERLLVLALARTRADWARLRGEDPYHHARRELAARYALSLRRHRRSRGGLLGALPPRERLVLVLRLFEGVGEEQTAAALGLPVERVRLLLERGTATLLSRPPAGDAPARPRARRARRARAGRPGAVPGTEGAV
ncbi:MULTISPECIES: sigma factor-like helix-turn-helix DNA-binding protein [Streptomyces]|uniref:RNA polymerase sigma-70 region 4 domain-containing protein n=2 Tax=Streptomyces cacaoi TaxID=1898 RepID=A0A4Y3R730_STRCI|nr:MULTISPECIES: sigma factor-like helix-turn-helix DNA-binding protein [Streptomyces]GEB53441.1 hypothetical protein SCA03_59920 [Streptomyces cacaoi]